MASDNTFLNRDFYMHPMKELTFSDERLEQRKFRWMNFGLIGMGVSIALITQKKDNLIVLALVLFALLTVFEAIGLLIVEKKIVRLGKNPWYVDLWFYESTAIDVFFLVAALLSLGIGVFIST